MKLNLETTPDQDAALQAESDRENIGQGDHVQPPLDVFSVQWILTQIDTLAAVSNAAAKAQKLDSVKQKLEAADAATLDSVAALLK